MARKLFCEYGPIPYWISTKKERLKRLLSNAKANNIYAQSRADLLPYLVASYSSTIAHEIEGVQPSIVQNRALNIERAANAFHQVVIHPGETFSFWKIIGNCNQKSGYKKAFVVSGDKLVALYGGGVCLIATMIHNLILNTPLRVTELHHHTDALFPDKKDRVPYELGVSLFYNYIDYQFQNNSEQTIQLAFSRNGDVLTGFLYSERAFPYEYKLIEEDHFFKKEADGNYYRHSKISRLVYEPTSKSFLQKELVRDNHSLVLYDPVLIPSHLLK